MAESLQRLGAKVTLVLGPVGSLSLDKNIKLIRFKFFNELKNAITRELKSKKYDIVIHSAAVSDYRPAKSYDKKIKSGMKYWNLKLVPTVKIIDLIRKIGCSLFLVGFKFETGLEKKALLKEAKRQMLRLNLDLVVANSIDKDTYLAYILEPGKIYGPKLNKKYLVQELVNITREKIWKG